MSKLREPLRNRKGQALVEMMLVLPFLLLVFSGVVDMGFVYQRNLMVNEAAREGARLAALGKDNGAILAAVQRYDSTLTTTTSASGKKVTVTVKGTVALNTPLVKQIFTPSPYPVQASATMLKE